MKNKSYLEELKKEYYKISPSSDFIRHGWMDLRQKLEEKDKRKLLVFRFAFISGSIVVVLLLGIFFLVQAPVTKAALPGQPLYLVKRLSENVLLFTTGNKHIKLDNRAQEIIDLGKKDNKEPKYLKEAVREYQEAVSEAKKENISSRENDQQLEKKLKAHEDNFREVTESSSGKEVKDAIEEAIKSGQGNKGQGKDGEDDVDKDNDRKENEEKEESGRSGSNSGSD